MNKFKTNLKFMRKQGAALFVTAVLIFSAFQNGCAKSDSGSAESSLEAASESEDGEQKSVSSENGAKKKRQNESEADKKETVYVKSYPDGSAYEVAAEVTLKNGTSLPIKDYSVLTDIKNTEGNEELTFLGNNLYEWENQGEDITYEGKMPDSGSSFDLPVTLKLSYFLDGKEISAEDVKNITGELEIHIEYTNNTFHSVKLEDGTNVRTCVPFIALTTVFFPKDHCEWAFVDNGETAKTGDQIAVIGYAMPGFSDALAEGVETENDLADIPDSVAVSAYVVDFTMDFTATVISNGLLEDLKDEDLSELDDLKDAFEDLNEASEDILEGINKLYDGANEFGSGLDEYSGGISGLNDGFSALWEGIDTLEANAPSLLEGAEALEASLEQVSEAAGRLNSQLGDSSASTDMSPVADALAAVFEDTEKLSSLAAGMIQSAEVLRNFISETSGCTAKILEFAQSADEALGQISEAKLSEADAEAVETARGYLAKILAEELPAAPVVTIDTGELSDIGADLAYQSANLSQIPESLGSFSSGMGVLQDALSALTEAITQIASGSAALTEGISRFNSGVSALSDGASEFGEGISSVNAYTEALTAGYDELIKGIGELKDGYGEFHEDGIEELAERSEEELAPLLNNIRALKIADYGYNNYSGKLEAQTSSATFIIETDGID